MNDSRIHWKMKIARDDRAVKLGCSDWCGLHHSTLRKGHHSKLLVVHKGGRCNFWGLLQLATLDLTMIAVALKPSWLVWIITVMPLWLYFLSFLFCSVLFLNSNFVYYSSVSCVWFLLPFVSLRENLQNSDCPFRFLVEDFRLCSRYNNINYGAWHVHKPLFGCSVATCWLACFEIPLSINEKKLEESPGKGRT